MLAYVWFWRRLSSSRNRKVLLIAGAAMLIVSALVLFTRRPGLMGRTAQWDSAIDTIDLAVFTGQGGEAWVREVVSLQPKVGTQLHNSFLSALAWGGLPGLMLLIALWTLAFTASVQAVRRGNLASLALLTTCLVLSMTESTFAYRYWSMGNALLLAAVLLSQWQPPSRSKDLPTAPGAQIEGLQGAPVRRPR
jgi:hypothetical protein